jgi:hypothetical protein
VEISRVYNSWLLSWSKSDSCSTQDCCLQAIPRSVDIKSSCELLHGGTCVHYDNNVVRRTHLFGKPHLIYSNLGIGMLTALTIVYEVSCKICAALLYFERAPQLFTYNKVFYPARRRCTHKLFLIYVEDLPI